MKKLIIAIVAIIMVVTIAIDTPQPLSYQIVILGDSIVANYNGQDGITTLVGAGLNKTIFNGAIGGSTLAEHNEQGYETNWYQSLSFAQLSDAIVAKDFTTQIAAIDQLLVLDFYEERIRDLALINFEEVEVLILEGMVNDFALQIDPKEVEEMLMESIVKLQKKYPELEIILSTPTYCYIYDETNSYKRYCDNNEDWTYLLEDYVAVQYAVADTLNLILVDQYYESAITKDTIEYYSDDGLHLSAAGRLVVSENIINSLQNADVFEEE
ncbi:MAG: SGNH/GDSL hydrolase family protein [Lachnospiraceae bacterium]